MKRQGFLVGTTVLVLMGCQSLNLAPLTSLYWPGSSTSSHRDDDDDEGADAFQTKVNTPKVGQYVTFVGLEPIVLHGVGLVVGLNGTGGDPAPSQYRTELLQDMKRRGVARPNEILKDRSTALVLVCAFLPPLAQPGDHFDVEVRLPGDSDATSLNGGWLMETRLREKALVPGKGVLKGHEIVKASGPILISADGSKGETVSALLQRGRVLGGGVALKGRDISIYLRNDFKSIRNSGRIAKQVGNRFFQYNEHGQKESLAVAKTDKTILLKIHNRYKDNIARYLQVIRAIAFHETELARHVRIQNLQKQLNDPVTSAQAAVDLEAVGKDGVPILLTGLKNPSLEVQFYSAMALAYLGESKGLPVLARAAREEPAFRVFALAGMAVIEDAESNILLEELLNEKSAETRYGAFRALTSMDADDPFIRGEDIGGKFKLHLLKTTGTPMVHLSTRKKAEIVLFGENQRLQTPISIRAGEQIRVSATPGSNTLTVSRYQPGKPDRRVTISTDIAEVIRTVAGKDFDASYPDVAAMLFEAARQDNLLSRVEIDVAPRSGSRLLPARSGIGRRKNEYQDRRQPTDADLVRVG